MKKNPLTYSDLLADQTQLVTQHQLNAQTAANRATALRLFLRANHLQIDDVVGLEMRPHFPLAVDKLVDVLRQEGRPSRSITNTLSALKHWKNAVIADDTDRAQQQNQATPFVQTLKSIVGEHSVKRLAHQAGVPKDMLIGWLRGKIPRASNAKYIRRVEGFFGVDRESLVKLAGIIDDVRPRERVGEAVPIDYRHQLGAHTKHIYYLVPPDDSPLRLQWKTFMRYKTAPVPTLLRSSRGRWTFSPLKVKKEKTSNWAVFLDGVEVPSAHVVWSHIASFFGWLALPKDQGGQGMSQDTLQTLAWLVVPDHIEAFLSWKKDRSGGKHSKSTNIFFGIISSLVRPRVGYLYQSPTFLKTLPESYHEQDWCSLCLRQFEYIDQLQKALAPDLESSRDPFEPIRSVIDLPQPMEAIADMIQRMRRDRPVGSVVREAIWSRDIFLVKLFVSNPIRLRNMATLTWCENNIEGRHPSDKASLYQRGDGSWRMFIPKRLFKNRKRIAMLDYDSPVHSSVWCDLERYLFRHRNDLLRFPTDLVFLTPLRDPARTRTVDKELYKREAPTGHTPFMGMQDRIFNLTEKYLWKSDGVGPHAFRHLVATAILKTDGGDIKTAALVLNDTETTVAKNYSGMRSGDGATRMGELLGNTLNRM